MVVWERMRKVEMSSYLFILCPPYSGSTVLWKLVSTSEAVSSLPTEGQFIPEVKAILRATPWRVPLQLPWKDIKAVWDRYWDPSKPLLVEKSPPHLMRTHDIVEHFNPVHFLIMVRNPYAHCEGLMPGANETSPGPRNSRSAACGSRRRTRGTWPPPSASRTKNWPTTRRPSLEKSRRFSRRSRPSILVST